MAEIDPFTQVYRALWDLLEKRGDLKTLVRLKNRIRFDERNTLDPIKEEVSTADLPELMLVPTGSTPHIQRTSNGSSCVERLDIKVSTGTQLVHEGLYPLKWMIYRALSDWKSVLDALTWNGETFVRLTRPTGITDGVSDLDLKRGVDGWASIWACEVEMWFTTTDLLLE